MNTPKFAPDAEFAAIQTVFAALTPLEPDSRQRVVEYVTSRLDISTVHTARTDSGQGKDGGHEGDLEPDNQSNPQDTFESFAELFDAAQPHDNPHKALVAGYWIQVCGGADSFSSFLINKALKDLGHGLSNSTAAITRLKAKKPALVVQLAKRGTSKQARKTYKVTVAGIRDVEKRISG